VLGYSSRSPLPDGSGPPALRVTRAQHARFAVESANAATKIRNASSREYARYLARAHTPLEITFVGFENGKTKWSITRFYVRKDKDGLVIEPRSEQRREPPRIYGVGYWGPAARYVNRHPKESVLDLEGTIIKGLEEAASADPYKGVGGPYSILRIDATGHTWTEQGECRLD
jgi:hypothetical protein